jgi:hypothetical protein
VSVCAKTDRERAVYARLYGGGVTLLCARPGRRAQTAVRFFALRPAEVIPPEISGLGFNFGHASLGTTEFEIIQFVFHFYGFETYNMLVNPNNHLVKTVLTRMMESGDHFFFAISPTSPACRAFMFSVPMGSATRNGNLSTVSRARAQEMILSFLGKLDSQEQGQNRKMGKSSYSNSET